MSHDEEEYEEEYENEEEEEEDEEAGEGFDKYILKTKANECRYGKRTSDETLIDLMRYLTVVCFLGRPSCPVCPFIYDKLYCPAAAAGEELCRRGYVKTEVICKGDRHYEYRKPSPISTGMVI